jgi:hypothetical protein
MARWHCVAHLEAHGTKLRRRENMRGCSLQTRSTLVRAFCAKTYWLACGSSHSYTRHLMAHVWVFMFPPKTGFHWILSLPTTVICSMSFALYRKEAVANTKLILASIYDTDNYFWQVCFTPDKIWWEYGVMLFTFHVWQFHNYWYIIYFPKCWQTLYLTHIDWVW